MVQRIYSLEEINFHVTEVIHEKEFSGLNVPLSSCCSVHKDQGTVWLTFDKTLSLCPGMTRHRVIRHDEKLK